MSAYMVEKVHIDVLVRAGLNLPRPQDRPLRWFTKPTWEIAGTERGEALVRDRQALVNASRELRPETADRTGQMLVLENRRSVDHRYDETEPVELYHYEDPGFELEPVEVLRAVACYRYQACEHPDFGRSEAESFLTSLEHVAIKQLPGYEKAERDWTDEKAAKRRAERPAPMSLTDLLIKRGF